jgi:hypothetical protein
MASTSIQCSARPIVTTSNLPTSLGRASALLSIKVMGFEESAAAFLVAAAHGAMWTSGAKPTSAKCQILAGVTG